MFKSSTPVVVPDENGEKKRTIVDFNYEPLPWSSHKNDLHNASFAVEMSKGIFCAVTQNIGI